MKPGDTVTWTGSSGHQHLGVLVGWTQSNKPRVRRYQVSTRNLGPIVTLNEVHPTKVQLSFKEQS